MFAKVKEYCLLAEVRFKISLRGCGSETGKEVSIRAAGHHQNQYAPNKILMFLIA